MKKILISAGLLILLGGLSLAEAQTSEPQLNLTWQARTYAPPEYAGKHLPSGYSRVLLALDAIQNGKVLDLSRQTIYWYRNDDLFASGTGLIQAEFTTPNIPLGSLDVRAEVPGLDLLKTIPVRMSVPLAVAEAPFPGGEFREQSLTLSAKPYFFNVSDMGRLAYEWLVNGKAPDSSEQPQKLTINVNPGTSDGYAINVALRIENPGTSLENAGQSTTLTYRQ